jgi:hypothetical protein
MPLTVSPPWPCLSVWPTQQTMHNNCSGTSPRLQETCIVWFTCKPIDCPKACMDTVSDMSIRPIIRILLRDSVLSAASLQELCAAVNIHAYLSGCDAAEATLARFSLPPQEVLPVCHPADLSILQQVLPCSPTSPTEGSGLSCCRCCPVLLQAPLRVSVCPAADAALFYWKSH